MAKNRQWPRVQSPPGLDPPPPFLKIEFELQVHHTGEVKFAIKNDVKL